MRSRYYVFIVESPLAFVFHLSHLTNLNFISKKLFDQESEGKLKK